MRREAPLRGLLSSQITHFSHTPPGFITKFSILVFITGYRTPVCDNQIENGITLAVRHLVQL